VLLITFGHGTASAERIAELLRSAGVTRLIDVRIAPGSRRNPHAARAGLERWLPRHGISYRWEKRLGGFRQPEPGSPDVAWQEAAFRGYAGQMRRPDFLAAIDELLAPAATDGLLPPAATGQLAVMCSESTWWRCHRRLIADFAEIARGVPVRHLMHDGALAPHRHSPGVRLRADGLLVYDGGQQQLG
jgi:uncharacterized protein (DUF488 family)